MYYLDFSSLHKITTRAERVAIRKELAPLRNEIMAKRLKQQHDSCFYCGDPITMFDHLDHMIPVYKGGTNRLSNLVAACKSCNMTKMADQIEITNEYTIRDYKRRIAAYKKWKQKIKNMPIERKKFYQRYQPKLVTMYGIYRADLFREI